MGEEDSASKVLECSISSSNGLNFLDLAIYSFCSGIELLVAQRIADAFSVSFKHLGDLDDLLYSFVVHILEPELEILFCIRKSAASKDGLKVLS